MTTHVLGFVELSDRDRKQARLLADLGKGERIEVRVRRKSGEDQTVLLPPKAADLLRAAFGHLLQGQRVASLAPLSSIGWMSAISLSGMWADIAAPS
jgi:hypothetical protein